MLTVTVTERSKRAKITKTWFLAGNFLSPVFGPIWTLGSSYVWSGPYLNGLKVPLAKFR